MHLYNTDRPSHSRHRGRWRKHRPKAGHDAPESATSPCPTKPGPRFQGGRCSVLRCFLKTCPLLAPVAFSGWITLSPDTLNIPCAVLGAGPAVGRAVLNPAPPGALKGKGQPRGETIPAFDEESLGFRPLRFQPGIPPRRCLDGVPAPDLGAPGS